MLAHSLEGLAISNQVAPSNTAVTSSLPQHATMPPRRNSRVTERAAEKLQLGAGALSTQAAIDQVVDYMQAKPEKAPPVQHAVMGANFVYTRVVTTCACLS